MLQINAAAAAVATEEREYKSDNGRRTLKIPDIGKMRSHCRRDKNSKSQSFILSVDA